MTHPPKYDTGIVCTSDTTYCYWVKLTCFGQEHFWQSCWTSFLTMSLNLALTLRKRQLKTDRVNGAPSTLTGRPLSGRFIRSDTQWQLKKLRVTSLELTKSDALGTGDVILTRRRCPSRQYGRKCFLVGWTWLLIGVCLENVVVVFCVWWWWSFNLCIRFNWVWWEYTGLYTRMYLQIIYIYATIHWVY